MATAADWLFSGILLRFPNLAIALSEGGIGWVPILIDRIGHMDRMLDYSVKFGELSPVEVLHRNFWFTTFNDQLSMPLRHVAGIDNIMVETDYPHSDSTWPDTQEILAVQLADVPDDEADRMTHLNATALYRVDELTGS